MCVQSSPKSTSGIVVSFSCSGVPFRRLSPNPLPRTKIVLAHQDFAKPRLSPPSPLCPHPYPHFPADPAAPKCTRRCATPALLLTAASFPLGPPTAKRDIRRAHASVRYFARRVRFPAERVRRFTTPPSAPFPNTSEAAPFVTSIGIKLRPGHSRKINPSAKRIV